MKVIALIYHYHVNTSKPVTSSFLCGIWWRRGSCATY